MSVDSVECFLRVIRVEGIEWERSFGSEKPKLYVRIQLGKSTAKTREIENTTEPWDELLILPQVDSSKDISIKLFHGRIVRHDVFLGSSNIQLSELSSKWVDGSFPLPLEPGIKDIGSLTLRVHLLNPTKLLLDIENDIDAASQAVVKLGNVEQGVVLIGSGEELYKSLLAITNKLSVFVTFMDKLTKISPYADVAWQVVSAQYKVIKHQKETDGELVELAVAMKDAYEFVIATESLPEKVPRLQQTINKFLKKTAECCCFILGYTKHDFFSRMLHMSRPKIDEFARCFDGLKKALGSDVGLHTAVAVQKIYKEVNLIFLKGLLMPCSMEAFSRGTCLSGTREEILIDIINWIRSDTKQNTLWIRGVAGSGKSTITTTVSQHCRNASVLGAFVFFNRDSSTTEIRASVFRTIAYQLAESNSTIAGHVDKAIKHNMHLTRATAEEQVKKLLLEPLEASRDEVRSPVIIIIEALDEYGSVEERRRLMSLLKQAFRELPPNIRFIITSRPEADIIASLSDQKDSVSEFALDSASEDNIRDVRRYIEHGMSQIFLDSGLDKPSDWSSILQKLAKASEGLFIWASTAIRLVGENPSPLEKLEDIANRSHLLKGLDRLYDSVLKNAGVALEGDEPSTTRLSQVLGLILLSKVPLTDDTIDGILGFSSRNSSRLIISKLQSILTFIPGKPIRLLHASFADYLSTTPCSKPCSTHQQSNCPSRPWLVNTPHQKSFIAKRCFEVMKDMLHFNMCSLETSFQLNEGVPDLKECIKGNIPSHLAYACMHWAKHLCDVPYAADSMDLHDLMEELKSFVYNQLLYWLEVLGLLGKIGVYNDSASRALESAAEWSAVHDKFVSSFMSDASELVTTFAESITKSTPHIYISMIPLMKEESKVAGHYSQRVVSQVKVERIGMKLAPLWLKTLEGHTGSVVSVAISPDGRCVASGSLDNTIRIWDIQRGSEIYAPLEGHHKTVSAVAFSPDGQRIVSGSWDKTIRIWDTQSGQQVLGPLEGHSDAVTSVAFSPLGTHIVSGSRDKTIRIWDTGSGRMIKVIEGHSGAVYSVVFTPNESRIVSCAIDETIRVWDTETGHTSGEPIVGHNGWVCSITVSSDGMHVVSGSWDQTVRVWDIESGKIISGPLWHPHCVESVAFSPDGKRIASGTGHTRGGRVVVWDVENGEIVCGPFTSHTGWVTSVAFTPDGEHIVSGSFDKTIRIWDASIGKVDLGPYVCHIHEILCVVYSPDGTRIASGSRDGTLGLWDVATCKLTCAPFAGHKDAVNSVAFSRDGHCIVSGSSDKTVIIWDVETGKIKVGPLAGHVESICSVNFSPDGTRMTSASEDETIIIWNAESGEMISQLSGVLCPAPSFQFGSTAATLQFLMLKKIRDMYMCVITLNPYSEKFL